MSNGQAQLNKKIIICCDGTWQDQDSGYTKPTITRPYGVLQTPSNVVRISRALRRTDCRGKPQIIYYQSGVGSDGNFLDKLTGGLLGSGISDHIREAYAFVTTNYVPGDEIVLIGFSRGAFTARSVAGLIRDIGLLNRRGMADFFAIFKDVENHHNPHYRDIFPGIPFLHKPRGRHFIQEYRRRLVEAGLTRVDKPDGRRIDVLAVGVWDTVGSLGIPTIGWLQKMGRPHSTKELKFHDTALNNTTRHAFQALALDEHRAPFSPAVWERREEDDCRTDLRQVWFAGAHSNVGGGYDDQEIANVALAWMMDQLASVGCEFQDNTIDRIYEENCHFYEHPPTPPTTPRTIFSRKPWKEWAIPEIFEKHKPVRPWGLGEIFESDTGYYHLTGRTIRTPGMYRRPDPDSGEPTTVPMTHTNERIHSSVRIRLELEGLDVDDVGLYKCEALLGKGLWELRKVRMKVFDPIPHDAPWGAIHGNGNVPEPESDSRWVWEYVGPKHLRPDVRTMVEENLGPYERQLLLKSKGNYGRRKSRRRRRRRSVEK